MFSSIVVFSVLLHVSIGQSVDDCFEQQPNCKVDDSQNPPYCCFSNYGKVSVCLEACYNQNQKRYGTLSTCTKKTDLPCQMVVSKPGQCKLYHQANVCSYQKATKYGNMGVKSKRQTDSNEVCYTLKPGCTGYSDGISSTVFSSIATSVVGTTTAIATTTTTINNHTKCYTNRVLNKTVKGNDLTFFTGPQFDQTLSGCMAKCTEDAKCVSINFYEKSVTDPAQCVTHSDACIEVKNCIPTDPEQSEYWEKIPFCLNKKGSA